MPDEIRKRVDESWKEQAQREKEAISRQAPQAPSGSPERPATPRDGAEHERPTQGPHERDGPGRDVRQREPPHDRKRGKADLARE